MNFFIKRDHKKISLMAALLLSSGLCALGIHQAAATEPQLEKAIQDGEALFVHETFGGAGVVEIPDLQDLLHYICEQGFEHHVAANFSSVAEIVNEAATRYLDWDIYSHGKATPC